MGLAGAWREAGEIGEEDRDEIVAMVGSATILDWRPLIYVIPFEPVAARVKNVPRAKRASQEPEFIIEDLARSEFEIIEPMPLL